MLACTRTMPASFSGRPHAACCAGFALPASSTAFIASRGSRISFSLQPEPECRTTCLPYAVVNRVGARRSQFKVAAHTTTEPRAAARSRLQGLLQQLDENNEDELMYQEFEEAAPELKVLLAVCSGGLMTGLAWLLCTISHSDLLGGLQLLSPDTWAAAGIGVAVGLPLAGLRAFLWTSTAKQTFPVLTAVKEAEQRALRPFLSALSPLQVAAVAAAEVVPEVLLLLPAAQGGLTLSFGVYASLLHAQTAGLSELLPFSHSGELPAALAIAVTALLCSLAHYSTVATSGEEYEVVENAINSADRYYRVLAMQPAGSAGSADQMASAFKSVASAWIHQQQAAGMFLAAAKAVDVVILCVLWRATGNLAAPLIAQLLMSSSDIATVYHQTLHSVTKLR